MPDLPYFMGDPEFQHLSPAPRKEAIGETKSPVYDRLIDRIERLVS